MSEDVMRLWSAAGSGAPRRFRRVGEGGRWMALLRSKGGLALRLPAHSKEMHVIRHHVRVR